MTVDPARLDRPLHVLRSAAALIAHAFRIAGDIKALSDGATEAEIAKLTVDAEAFAQAIKAELAYAKAHRSEARHAQAQRILAAVENVPDNVDAIIEPEKSAVPKRHRRG